MKSIIAALKRYQYKHIDFRLVVYLLSLSILGIMVIGSASASADGYQQKQILGLIIGIIVMITISLIDYKFILKFYWIIYAINIIMLLCVTFFGSYHMGAKRWIDIGSQQLQPSEFTKIFIILFFAMYIQKFRAKLNTFKVVAGAAVLIVIPLLLIFKQPDLSTTIILFLTFCAIMYLSGLSYKIIAGILVVAIPIAACVLYLAIQPDSGILEEYQYNRIVGFYQEDNEAAADIRYQQENSILAIGSGGLTGKGLNNNTITSVKNGNFLSEPHTDFIFTIVGEELGFIGCASVIILLALIVFECFWIGLHSSDISGRIFACGFGTLIAFQAIVNIAVVTMLIPNTGLTLPFVSYGLSSLVSLFAGMGIVLNIGMQRRKNLYEEVRF
ncbi:MAG: FtsW/RodA/SpoVE family cell cycle protein [Eubacterium sp.]